MTYDILGFKAGVQAHHLKKSYELLHVGIAPTSPCFSEGLMVPTKSVTRIVQSGAKLGRDRPIAAACRAASVP